MTLNEAPLERSFFFLLDGSLSSSDEPSSSGSKQSDFLSVRGVSADGRGMPNMLLITSSMGMVYGVHSHSSNSWPSSSLCLGLMVWISGFAHWLVGSSTSSNDSNHGSAVPRNSSSASTWKSHSGLLSIIWMSNDDCWSATCSCERSSVTSFSFTVWNNSSFWHGVDWQDIADWEWSYSIINIKRANLTLGTAIDELTGIKTFHCNEILSSMLISVGISKHYSGKRCSSAWVVNYFLDNSLNVPKITELWASINGIKVEFTLLFPRNLESWT